MSNELSILSNYLYRLFKRIYYLAFRYRIGYRMDKSMVY